MKRIIGIILSLVLLCSTYAPSLTLAAETASKVGWVKENGELYYYEKPGVKRTTQFTLDGVEYNVGRDGRLFFGTKKINGQLVYYDEPGKLKTGWKFSGNAWSYLKDGLPVIGSFTYKEKKFEINKYGEMEKGWITLRSTIKRVYPKPETKFLFESKPVKDGEILEVIGKQGLWYQVNYQGEIGYVRIFESVVIEETPVTSSEVVQEAAFLSHFMITGYKKDPEKYFPTNIIKGFEKQLDDDRHVIYDSVQLVEKIKSRLLLDNKQGWIQKDGKWIYYRKDGQRATGFQTIDGKRYYFDSSGIMQTGWTKIENRQYYFSPAGVMQVGLQYIDSKMYYFNEGGFLTTGLHFVDGIPHYFDDTHEQRSGWMKMDYDWYLLHPSSVLQTGDFTYKDKKFSFNQDGEMVKGWIVLESLVKKVYPEPDLKRVLRAKHVEKGEIIEVTGKTGPWYEVKYQGEKGYVRIHDSIIFDQEAKSPLTLLDGKLKIFQGVFDYLKNDETLVNDTFKILEKAEQNAMDDVELWQKISKDLDQQAAATKEQIRLVKEARDKMQELVTALKGDIKNLTVTQRQELLKLIGEDAAKVNQITDVMVEAMIDTVKTLGATYELMFRSLEAYYRVLGVYQDKTNEFLKDMSDAIVQIGENHRKLREGFTGAVQDLGKVAESSIRLKKSIEVAKPKMEELARQTQETVPVIAGHLQTLQEKVPGFYTDVNTGLDFANAFMDSANKIASHKVDIPAAARNIGNIDLSNSLRDFGVSPGKINEYIADQNNTNKIMNTTLDIVPILNVPKEAIQMYQGKEMGTDRKYDPSDYAMGVLSVATGGTVKTIGKVVGTVADLEKKAKNLEKAAKGGRSGEIILDRVQTYEQARNKAMDILGNLGEDSKPFMGTLEKSAGYGKIIGRQTADNKARWRLDYDPSKGLHINVEDFRNGKGSNAKKYAIPIEGNEETFKSLLKHLNK
ncbi:S-layer protein [Bacillus pseudomycoides]|uniref:S-layer protein n=1 Tax=Bacillus pseudomycoides TaxID=64104 RepID=UPI000BEBC221|nr:S-layer protein [Bacillus pseudomycoides]PED05108.1 S-layer protein [Bacillus pseudomycoides]PEI85518.1 S-layer protein [Bacillus pseudomycoides]PEK10658.1 S-layer protein [Bacillus pseudomycoides]PEM70776.1 S-layer protein [Bacillus pseudomycoides]PEO10149.1 S-layer protein [Bacillus pseudomycoides]